MVFKHSRWAFWRGFSKGMSAPYRLSSKPQPYQIDTGDLIAQSWREVGQALRVAMAQEPRHEQAPRKTPRRAA